MKLKSAVKYQLNDSAKSVCIFYGVIYTIFIAMLTIISFTVIGEDSNMNGLESSTIIFLFVVGLNSFKSQFKLFLQNGLSRKTLFVSFGISSAVIALFMNTVDTINKGLLNIFIPNQSGFDQIYAEKYITSASYIKIFDNFIWSFFIYLAVLFLGYFISTLYYRMNKWQKLLVSIGVPVFLIMVLPIIDAFITKGAISTAIQTILVFALGVQNGINPYMFVLSCIVASIVFGILGYLLTRKATVKD